MDKDQNNAQGDQPKPGIESVEEQTESSPESIREKLLARFEIGYLYEKIQTVLTRVFQMVIILVIALFVFATIRKIAFPDPGPVFETFKIPEPLQRTGLTGEVFAIKLLDRTIEKHREIISKRRDSEEDESVLEEGQKEKELLGLAIEGIDLFQAMSVDQSDDLEETQDIQIPIPGIEISLDMAVMKILEIFNLEQHPTRIGGEIILRDGLASLSIRISGKLVRTFQSEHENERDIDIDELLDQGAEHILKTLYPVSVGTAYAGSAPDSLELLISQLWQNNPVTVEEKTDVFILEGLHSLVVENNCERALFWLERASYLDSENALPHYFSAYILATCMKKYDEADEEFETAIDLAEENADMLILWARMLYQQNKNREAEERFSDALRSPQDLARVYVNWGETLSSLATKYREEENTEAQKKTLGAALDKYQKAGFWGPKYVKSYVNWGDLYRESADPYSAMAKYKEAIKYDPGYIHAYIKWAETLIELSYKDIQSFRQFREFNEALLKYRNSTQNKEIGSQHSYILRRYERRQRTISESALNGVWEAAGHNATILRTDEGWGIYCLGWKKWWPPQPIKVDFDPDNPFEPKVHFWNPPKEMRLVGPRKIIHANNSVWTKYQPKDFAGEWEAGGKTIMVKIQDKIGRAHRETVSGLSRFGLPEGLGRAHRKTVFDLSGFGLPEGHGNIEPDTMNMVRFLDGPIRSAELTHIGEMRLVFRDNHSDIPEKWKHRGVKWSFEGKWMAEGGDEATIYVKNGELRVHIDGLNEGIGKVEDAAFKAGALLRADVIFRGYNKNRPFTANLRTPNLIYWDGFDIYWQRKEEPPVPEN